MTASEIRASFLEFFSEKQHTVVPSASLMPQSPGLLFTNAGMNQFVPYFLGTEKAPYSPPRAADTQKCIRAGGKHNDLEDVGYDTYHHTFFEMLGNWSFGDYFKKEAIAWGWELIVEKWGVPAERLYATVYNPGEGDPSSFDQEAYDLWAELFKSKGLDPAVHIVNGNVKDNFWMMGETGPCGPCSELHVDLTPNADSGGKLVNMDSDLCIEIWNLVFIQYNAEADGTFRDLPAKHVDTGMGFERACSLIQNTKGFTDFSKKPTNYATDVFQPIFRKLEELSGKTYTDIYPEPGADRAAFSEEMKTAVAFRVIADHLRTLSFSIADGIMPGNNGRNYVLRRILRRAVRYGRQLGFSGEKPFFGDLAVALVDQMGDVFPELKTRQESVKKTLEAEEASFNQTLDRGLKRFEEEVTGLTAGELSGDVAFQLYDTFGFPIDLTELLCAERGLKLDMMRFEKLMEQQRKTAQAAQKSTVVRALDVSSEAVTEFVGFDADETDATIVEIHPQDDSLFVITDKTVFFAEMGGQAGDTGVLVSGSEEIEVAGTQQIGKARAHIVDASSALKVGDQVKLKIDITRRRPIEAHHTATHLLHWALHEAVSQDASQQGSSVDENRLRFDFNSSALTPKQISEMEEMVNGAIKQNMAVSWTEVKHADIKDRKDIMQFFGDKYGEIVRVVEIGRARNALDGYSMELCGGTHVRDTGEIGLFKIKSEGAIASGVRRIEAVCGESAWSLIRENTEKWSADLKLANEKLKAANQKLVELGEEPLTVNEFPHIMGAMLVERADISQINATFEHGMRTLEETQNAAIEAEKSIKKIQSAQAAAMADEALSELIEKGDTIIESFESDASLLQELQNGLKKKGFAGAALLIVDDGEKLHLAVHCGADAIAKGQKAGDILRELAAIGGGKGGGKPDQARGAAPERDKLAEIKAAMERGR
ncbi:MAG: alanine--tRNA ligase [Akkermansiaceae bacterium]|jgi:alanyl-tRNA synthetase|nr:alanine--tRNA ligase [Akkermansiaceae bacterium]MDP4720203.1 alanine--tRNA ligase [Akkermansiaceae bacterium]MDP4779807.1 alanine--tRNA ligase [Akkermansiaceae bacterium]MDP4896706.1 alanine--tRNA ligase [Akkermansiaceae bacterium]